jgi:transcription termination factor Rho
MHNLKEIEGILYFRARNKAIVSEDPYSTTADEHIVPVQMVNRYHLEEGARIRFLRRGNNQVEISSINGKNPHEYTNRRRFEKLIVINPEKKFDLDDSNDQSLRMLDLMVPLAKGSRALIISPPRAGKTILLEKLACHFAKDSSLRTVMFLIDERPEEITHLKRVTNLPIFASSMDRSSSKHVQLADLLVKNIRQEVESGNDIVVLLDSLTRLGRAHNLRDSNSGSKILSGGLGSQALQIPRKLFGTARNIEEGGSCTIIATILHQTGSRMDEMIFQEFKGTGNCEIMLDRRMAELRLFPALDIAQSGTRREELFRSEESLEQINKLRRKLASDDNESALRTLLNALEKYPRNQNLLSGL